MAKQRQALDDLVEEYVARRIDRRQFFRGATALGLSLGAAGSLLAACGGSDDAAQETGESQTGTTPATGGTPQTGGILREGYDRDVVRIDPVNGLWWDASLFPASHETLVATDPNGQIVPALAESWEVSGDGLEWRFKIREGLTFQSGAPCDAAAIAAAMDHFRDPEGATTAANWEPVSRVSADGNTVVVTMAHPYFDFLISILNQGFASIYNKATRDELGDQYGVKTTDGTGPFTLKEFVPGSHVLLTRWDDYPGTISPFVENKGKAYLDEFKLIVLLEPSTRAQELEAGNIDALHAPAPQDVERLKGADDIAVIEFPEWSLYRLGLNFKRTDLGFDDVRVRQAVMHAIDRQAVVDTVFLGKGVPAYTLAPPISPYYDSALEEFGSFDPEQARALLEDAGWTMGGSGIREKNGQKLSFEVITEGADKAETLMAQAIQDMLKDVGLDMTFTGYGFAEYNEIVFGSNPPDGYMINNIWVGLIDSEITLLDTKFFTPRCCNWSFISVPEVDAAIAGWQNASTDDELTAAGRRLLAVVAEQAPYIPIATRLNVWAHNKRVHGWLPNQHNLYPFYNDVWIEA